MAFEMRKLWILNLWEGDNSVSYLLSPRKMGFSFIKILFMGQFGAVLFLAFRQRLGLMTSPEVPFQPKLFSDVAVDITYACLLLSVSNVTFAWFSQGITYCSWAFFGLNSVQGSKACAALAMQYRDIKVIWWKGISYHRLFFLCWCSCKMSHSISKPATRDTSTLPAKGLGHAPCVQVVTCICSVSCANTQRGL